MKKEIFKEPEKLVIPSATHFAICGMAIGEDCMYRKILEPGLYPFNDLLTYQKKRGVWTALINTGSSIKKDFYADNITIQAIVGKNGSGKSSLLDLLFRIVNNFAFLLERDLRRNWKYSALSYVRGVHASIYYLVDGHIGVLTCNDERMVLEFQDAEPINLNLLESYQERKHITQIQMSSICRLFFFTIGTNYSMQSLVEKDYVNERCDVEVKKERIKGIANQPWIHSVFHKNDGYLSPITLNPFREDGNINMDREYDLTIYRLSSIFAKAKADRKDLLDDYSLHGINYTFDEHILEEKFKNEELYFLKNYYSSKNRNKWKPNTLAHKLFSELGLLDIDWDDIYQRTAAWYIMNKVKTIAHNYPYYSEYRVIGDSSCTKLIVEIDKEQLLNPEDRRSIESTEYLIEKLVALINRDNSHITFKLKQCQHYLELSKRSEDSSQLLSFTYDKYISLLKKNNLLSSELKGIDDIIKYLPPSFYHIDIRLDKKEFSDDERKVDIPLNQLSSGERQFLYTISTFIYHLYNLLSIEGRHRRVYYRRMTLVLDEVEICFHPDYQRQFIDKLLSLLTRLGLNKRCSLNILIATHSPFILSDIPQSNILYLNKGHECNSEIEVNPFGANINEILHQSFFLRDSFIGGFAQRKIDNVVQMVRKSKDEKQLTDLKKETNFIGDDFLRQQIDKFIDYRIMDLRYAEDSDKQQD